MTTKILKSLISVLLCLIMQLNALNVYASARPFSSITPNRFSMVDSRTITNEFERYKKYSKYLQLLKMEMDAVQLMDINVKTGVHLTDDEKKDIVELFEKYNSKDAINDFLRMRQIDIATNQYDPEGLLYLLDNTAQIYTYELVDFKNAEINNRKARTQYEKLLRMGIDKLPVSDFYNGNRLLYNSFFNTPIEKIPNGFRHPVNRIDLVTSLPDSHLTATRLMDFENVGVRIKQRSELLASKLSEQKFPVNPVSANPETISKALQVYESFCFGLPQYGAFQSNYLLAAETYSAFKSTGNISYLQQIIRFGENAVKARPETTLKNQEAVNMLHYWLGRAYLLSGSTVAGIKNIEAFLAGIELHEKMLIESIEHKKDITEKAKQEEIEEALDHAKIKRNIAIFSITLSMLASTGVSLSQRNQQMSNNMQNIVGGIANLSLDIINSANLDFMKSASASVLQGETLAKFITPYSLKVNRYFDKYEMIDYFFELGTAYQSVGSIDKALENYEEAVNIIERQRSTIFKEDQKISFSATKQRLYAEIINLLVSKGNYDKALEYIERAKSRAFVDLMGSSKIKFQNDTLAKAFDNNVTNNMEMDALVSNRKISNDQIDELFRKYKRGLTIKEKDSMETSVQELSSLSNVQTLSSASIKQLAVADTAILEYYLTEDKLHICLIQDNNINVVTLKVNISDIIEKASQLKERIIKQGDDKSVAKYFHKLLIAPVEAKINSKQLVIIPHNVLHYLPFQAFFDGNQYLIEKYAISYAPSATILKLVEQKQVVKNGKALIIGNPTKDLRFAESEAISVSKLFKESKLLVGSEATETYVKNNAANYEFIHLASHGIYDDQNPLRSAIMLSPDKDNDGVLTTAELFAAKWQASLVTLSACETGLSKYRTGDELIGLQRGLMFAGARSVILSLWMVDDKATGSFMDNFYQYLSSKPKNIALQKAQIDAMKQYKKPYYWAAFNLAGSGI